MPAEKWQAMEEESPTLYWLTEHFSTPRIVRNPIFIVLSFFLFLSTAACTITRVNRWLKSRALEFEKEQAFSFSVERTFGADIEDISGSLKAMLDHKGWEHSATQGQGFLMVSAQKGGHTGFWGSVVFHIGLLVCFLSVPVTAFTAYRAKFITTNGVTKPYKEVLVFSEGGVADDLSDVEITVSNLRGVYAKGIYKVEFGGNMIIDDKGIKKEAEFSVNNPIYYKGYQIGIHEYGYSPGVFVSSQDGTLLFDGFLNLPKTGDYFSLSEDLSLFVMLFPDFFREGSKIGSRTNDPNNPILLIRILRGKEEIAKGLLSLGQETVLGGYTVKFTELRNWASFTVVKEYGMPVVAVGLIVGVAGLLVRFLSNERRLEISFKKAEGGTDVVLRGYSRYYPAFLEQEVSRMAQELMGEKSI